MQTGRPAARPIEGLRSARWRNSVRTERVAIFLRTVVASLTALGLFVQSGTANAASSHPLKAPYVRPGTPLTDTTLGLATTFGDVDMRSDSLGFAIAGPVNKGRGWFYLIRTSNLGNGWRVVAPLPVPSYVGPYGWGNAPSINFVSPSIGYLSLYQGPLWVTTDGGQKWTKMSTPGIWPTYSISDNVMFVTSDVCTKPTPDNPEQCASDLSQYHVGSVLPIRSVTIPDIGAGKWRAAQVLDALTSRSVVVVEGRDELPSSILVTTTAGGTWGRLINPCTGLSVSQLVTLGPKDWLLTCFGGGGMNQGTSELWRSPWGGNLWSLVAKASEQGPDLGDIRDVANTIYAGNSGTLFAALGGAAGGVEYSTDQGAHWISAHVALGQFGGAPETMTTFGASGAVVSAQNFGSFRTLNGTTWSPIPSLPSGRFKGLSICTSAKDTKVSLGSEQKGIPADMRDYPLIFTNDAKAACYLNGVPSVQTVAGTQHRALGGAAFAGASSGRADFVIVKAKGGTASVGFAIQDAHSYQRSYCVPRRVSGLSIKFAAPSSFYLRTPNWLVCMGIGTTFIENVTPGIANYH